MTPTGELITDVETFQALAREWDALAVTASNPIASPSWVLAWWNHIASPGFEPRVVVVRDRDTLIGVVPFYVAPSRRGVVEYRLMAAEFGACHEPLVLPGREWDVAAEVGRLLAGANPPPDALLFGPMTLASHWITALRSKWPAPMLGVVRYHHVEGVPVIALRDGSFDAWLASLGSKMRGELRRRERLFVEAGGTVRWSDAETLRVDAETFARLHRGRWRERGWSRLADLGDALPDWLEELGSELIERDRLRLCVLELAGEAVSVSFSLLAGGELAAINSGWDERYARFAPAKMVVLPLMRDAYRLGVSRVHLGTGEQSHKLSLANGNDQVARTIFLPPSLRLPWAYGSFLPEIARARARDVAGRALPPDWFDAVRGMGARLRR